MPGSTATSRAYSIVEPHPNVAPSKYVMTGRGGAANFTRAPATVTQGMTASGPAARAPATSLSKPRTNFVSGRGGAGNIHNASERAIFSFDEELERQMNQEVAPVYHVGRGGAGNVHASLGSFSSRRDSRSSAGSNASSESGADIATRKLKQGWKRMTNGA